MLLNFRQIALKNRRLLLLSLSFWHRQEGKGPAKTVAEITEKAVGWGYVGTRKPPTGATLGVWVETGVVPAWVAKATARILLATPGYQPKSSEEAYAFALALAEACPTLSFQDLREQIQDDLKIQVTESVVQSAVENRKV